MVVVQVVVGGLLGAVMGGAGMWLGRQIGGQALGIGALRGHPLLLVAMGVLGAWAAIALHELGHVLGGLSQGFRFVFLATGPLLVERSGDRLRVRWNRIPGAWGGLAACTPVDDRRLARRMAVMAAAGPAASLALALAAGAVGWAVTPASSLGLAAVRFLCLVVGGTSFFIFLATAFLPSTAKGFRSDGARARALLRGDSAAEREVAMLALVGLSMGSVRPRDWPAPLVERASEIAGGGLFEATAALLAMQHALDRKEPARAGVQLDRAMALWEAIPRISRPGFAAAAAHFEAAVRRDVERAQEWLRQARGPLVDAHQVHLAEAAVAHCAGDDMRALARAREGLAALPRARFGATAADREQLEAILLQAGPVPGESQAQA